MKSFTNITITMISCLLIMTTSLWAEQVQSSDAPVTQDQTKLIVTPLPAHPRLMLTPDILAGVSKNIATDPWAKQFFERIKLGSYAVRNLPVIERKLKGKTRFRMLATSRDAMHNIFTMGLSNTFEPDPEIRDRMIAEMTSIAHFEDWHPPHFLDTAEMTLAMAVGYDWLYNDLTDEQRTLFRDAIINLGLKPALTFKGGLNTNNNWNQVRHAGLVAGALAVYEDAPELSEEIIQQAHKYFKTALTAYEGGIYPEGPTYWGYGTCFSVLMAACLQTSQGNDWGISQSPGFYESFDFVLQVTAPTRQLFNFADCGLGPMHLPAHMWAGKVYNRPDFVTVSQQSFWRFLQNVDTTSFRINPLAKDKTQHHPHSTSAMAGKSTSQPCAVHGTKTPASSASRAATSVSTMGTWTSALSSSKLTVSVGAMTWVLNTKSTIDVTVGQPINKVNAGPTSASTTSATTHSPSATISSKSKA
jgi:hypothetical protein